MAGGLVAMIEELLADPMEGERLRTLEAFYRAEDRYVREGGGDFSAIAATLDPECVLRQPASLAYGGVWRGHAGFEAWMKAFAGQWASLEVKDPQTFVHEEHIFSRSHVYAVARGNGVKVDWPLLQMIVFRGARILELQPFYWDTAALLAGLRESERPTLAPDTAGREDGAPIA